MAPSHNVESVPAAGGAAAVALAPAAARRYAGGIIAEGRNAMPDAPGLAAELAAIKTLLERDRLAARERAMALAAAHPRALDPSVLLAAAHSLLQDYPAATSVLRGCWAEYPEPNVAFNLGYCLRQTGDYASALRLFLAALALSQGEAIRALAADTAAILGEAAFARRLLAGAASPILSYRAWTLSGGDAAAALGGAAAADAAVLFWMKYDCHLFGRLDSKATLATLLPAGAAYWPESFPLPDADGTAAARIALRKEAWWIVKPAAESGGRGMTVLRGPDVDLPAIPGVVQRLVDPPFLYAGRKPNLRLLLGLPTPRADAAVLWASGLVYLATEAYRVETGAAGPSTVANLLRAERAALATPLGDLPAHVVPLEDFLARVPELPDLRQALTELARTLVSDLERIGFLAEARAVGDAFPPRFLGVDVGLDADGKPWLFEIERYPGLGGVSPVTAAINARFRREWHRFILAGGPRNDANFLSLA